MWIVAGGWSAGGRASVRRLPSLIDFIFILVLLTLPLFFFFLTFYNRYATTPQRNGRAFRTNEQQKAIGMRTVVCVLSLVKLILPQCSWAAHLKRVSSHVKIPIQPIAVRARLVGEIIEMPLATSSEGTKPAYLPHATLTLRQWDTTNWRFSRTRKHSHKIFSLH